MATIYRTAGNVVKHIEYVLNWSCSRKNLVC